MSKKKFFISAALMCLATAVLTLAVVYFSFLDKVGGSDGLKFMSKLNTVRMLVDENFVGDVDWDSAADGAAAGLVDSIDDRWSYYMTSQEYSSYVVRSENTTTGIGVTVQIDEQGRGFYIVSVVEDGPAQRAGVQPGHILVSVAGEDVTALELTEVGAVIQSQEAEYELGLLDENGEAYTVTVKNEVVFTNPVSYELKENGIGYIRIDDFEKGAGEEGIKAIDSLLEQGAASLIFDVRSNPGGRLSELIELLDYILPEGDLFISVGSDGSEEIYTSDENCIENIPMAVLINANSYSAAEFFAAALSEYDYAELIGQASTGKARSQLTYVLSDNSAVHISTRSYLTPNRTNLAEEGGLVPDIIVDAAEDFDTQLQKAIEYLS